MIALMEIPLVGKPVVHWYKDAKAFIAAAENHAWELRNDPIDVHGYDSQFKNAEFELTEHMAGHLLLQSSADKKKVRKYIAPDPKRKGAQGRKWRGVSKLADTLWDILDSPPP